MVIQYNVFISSYKTRVLYALKWTMTEFSAGIKIGETTGLYSMNGPEGVRTSYFLEGKVIRVKNE